MEALLIVNSVLVAITLYFIKDVHGEFKEMRRSVQGLKERFIELSAKVNAQIKSIKERFGLAETEETEE